MKANTRKINGLMIDCSRLLERHEYYFRLIDFMAEWGMNLMLLHFTDDAGCAVALPGFERLAMPHAFSAQEIRALIRYAADRGIEMVPELETFGHTRFLTDRREYRHLYAGPPGRELRFNAIDPLHPDTPRIMSNLMKSVGRLFPSRYLHVGCDEVNLEDYCRKHEVDADEIWAAHVNRMFDLARACGKEPVFWADHPVRSARIASLLQKNVTAIWWAYHAELNVNDLKRLRKAGFHSIVTAPSTACFYARFLTPGRQFVNARKMAVYARRYRLDGMINTVWTTTRYAQGAMYFGIAYGAYMARHPHAGPRAFHAAFARKVFGTRLTRGLERFLTGWPQLDVNYRLAMHAITREPLKAEERAALMDVCRVAERILPLADGFGPAKNADIWESMVLAARAASVCAEGLLLSNGMRAGAARKLRYNRELRAVRKAMSEEWDRTRYPDDPKKYRPPFPSPVETGQHALAILRRLPLSAAGTTR